MKNPAPYLLVLLLVLSFEVSCQTLEIHQMAVGNADSGIIIQRDTTKVMNNIRIGLMNRIFTPTQWNVFKDSLTTRNVNTLAAPRSTVVLQRIINNILPGSVATLNGRLGTLFNTRQKRVNMMQTLVDSANARPTIFSVSGTVLYTVMIDIGRKGKEARHDGNLVYQYLKKQGVTTIDRFILSHYHDDHVGGLAPFLTNLGTAVGTFHDSGDTCVFTGARAPARKMKVATGTYTTMYRNVIKDNQGYDRLTQVDSARKANRLNVNSIINISPDIRLTCVASNSLVYGESGIRAMGYRGGSNPNDYSLAFVLTYKGFKFFTGGDLSGQTGGDCTNYRDVETDLSRALKRVPLLAAGPNIHAGHCCAFKVSHHGSECSSNTAFLDTLAAKVCFIPNGWDAKHYNPRQSTFARLNDANSLVNIFCLGLMRDNIRPQKSVYRPFNPLADLLGGKVIISGNVAIVVDDTRSSANRSEFIVKWDGNLKPDSEGLLNRLYPATALPTPPFIRYSCSH